MNVRVKALLTLTSVFVLLMLYTNEFKVVDSKAKTNSTLKDYSKLEQSLTDTIGKVRSVASSIIRPHYDQPPVVSDKWIVVTSINYPSEDVKRLASSKDWNLVVVADKKTPKDWHYDGVHFLSMEQQENLGLRLSVMLPENSYTRKNIGYLYAIKNGARWIYDTDDDNKPYGKGLQQFDFENFTSGLCYRKNKSGNDTLSNLFNPYRFFGNPGMWPRGFPLEHLHDHTNGKDRLCLCSSTRTPAVQQGLVHKDPDVDAIYRLLYADKQTGLDERFNEFAPPVVMNPGTYSPWNSQNTLFHRNAFFTLFLPVSVAFRVTDIWRSYFAQKLLHLIGERVAFYPVNAVQFRNAHNYLADFQQEIDVYTKSGKLIEFLENWQCSVNDISNCTVELAEQLGRLEFWQRKDSLMVKLWIEDLKTIGYEFPAMVSRETTGDECWGSSDEKAKCLPVYVELKTDTPATRTSKAIESIKQKVEYADELHEWCRKAVPGGPLKTLSYDYLAEKHSQHRSLVENLGKVLVIFVDQGGAGIGVLQRLYQSYFAAVIFCGKGDFVQNGTKASSINPTEPVNFVTMEDQEHIQAMAAKCLVRVKQMKLQNVTGYYAVSETILLQFWNWHDPKKALFPSQNRRPQEALWTDSNGEPTCKTAYKLINEKYKNDEDIQQMWKEYQQGLSAHSSHQSASEHIQADVGYADNTFIYIPSEKITYFSTLIRIFDEAKIPEGFAVSKFLDTVETEWLPPMSNVLTDDKGLDTKKLLAANPTRYTKHEQLKERKLFCTTIVTTFRKVLLDS